MIERESLRRVDIGGVNPLAVADAVLALQIDLLIREKGLKLGQLKDEVERMEAICQASLDGVVQSGVYPYLANAVSLRHWVRTNAAKGNFHYAPLTDISVGNTCEKLIFRVLISSFGVSLTTHSVSMNGYEGRIHEAAQFIRDFCGSTETADSNFSNGEVGITV